MNGDSVHQSNSLKTDGGGDPSIMSGSLTELWLGLESHANKLAALVNVAQGHISQHSAFMQYFDTGEMYALRYLEQKQNVSLEDINKTSTLVWDKTLASFKEIIPRLKAFDESIQQGAARTKEALDLLETRAGAIKNDAYEETFKINNFQRYNIDGTAEVKDVSALWDTVNNAFAFFLKVLIPYVDAITNILNKLQFDKEFTDDATQDFARFAPRVWMKGALEVENDERFSYAASVYRGKPVQSNRALYATGPTETNTEELKDWKFLVNTLRGFSIKYNKVEDLKDTTDSDGIFDVDATNNIRQRVVRLEAIISLFIGQKGNTDKLINVINKLQQAATRVRNKAGQMRAPDGDEHDDVKVPGMPSVSVIVNDTSVLVHNVMKMASDYYTTISSLLMTAGGLTHVADVELNSYIKPESRKVV